VARRQPSESVSDEIVAGDVMTMAEVGRQYHTVPSTAFRWVTKGLPGVGGGRVYLEAVRRGSKTLTSSAAIARFFARLEYAQSTSAAQSFRTPAKRERDSARAEKALSEKYGR